MNKHHQVATATFNAYQQPPQPLPAYDTESDPRWKVNPQLPANKYNFPENYQEAEDIKLLMQKLHVPDHDEKFMKVEKKDFMVHNRKQIGTIDTI